MEWGFQPDWIKIGVAGAAIALLLLWSYLTAKGRSKRPARWLFWGLRLLVLAGVTLCLLDPQNIQRLEHQHPARLAVLLDASRSMAVRDVAPDRATAAKTWLGQAVLPNLPDNASVSWFTFDQQLSGITGTTRMPPSSFANANPTGGVTALAGALDQLLTLQTSDPCLGVVLCSDGIETTREDPLAIARLYRQKAIPIHTATFGTTNEPRDVILENVQVKQMVANQARTRLTAALRSQGFNGETVPLVIRDQNNQVLAQKSVRLAGGPQTVEVEFTPRGKGYRIYEAAIPARDGEWLATNNRRPFGLEVADPSIHVIYMEGTPSLASQPEWKYLKDALESDPNIHCKVLFRYPGSAAVGINTVDADPTTGDPVYHVQHPTRGFPRTLPALLEYDVVINSDIPKESFSPEQLENTARLVEDYGGGFVMIGGKKAFGAGGYHRTVMNKFIPVAMERDVDTANRTFQMAPNPQALRHPLMAIAATPAENAEIWTTKFPLLRGYNRVGRAKPGAIVLGTDPTEANEYGPRVIMAAQEIGKGRTFAFTSDSTRTWGTEFETEWGEKLNPARALTERNCDARYYRQFWVNAIHWLAAGKAGQTNKPVVMELAHTVCRTNEPVTAWIRVAGVDQQAIPNATVTVGVNDAGGTGRHYKATYDTASRLYRALIAAPQTGDFTVHATASLNQAPIGDDKKLLVCEEVDPELARVRVNSELMGEIARVSGGQILPPKGNLASTIKNFFSQAPPAVVEIRRTPIWDRLGWLTLLLALLAAEWILRRRNGLA